MPILAKKCPTCHGLSNNNKHVQVTHECKIFMANAVYQNHWVYNYVIQRDFYTKLMFCIYVSMPLSYTIWLMWYKLLWNIKSLYVTFFTNSLLKCKIWFTLKAWVNNKLIDTSCRIQLFLYNNSLTLKYQAPKCVVYIARL